MSPPAGSSGPDVIGAFGAVPVSPPERAVVRWTRTLHHRQVDRNEVHSVCVQPRSRPPAQACAKRSSAATEVSPADAQPQFDSDEPTHTLNRQLAFQRSLVG